MRVVEFAPKVDWDSLDGGKSEHDSERPKDTKSKKVKKPKKVSKQRLKGGR